ncbi:MAG: penicillin-binding transpeptidase domain-containing protein [Bacillota bacterium]|nr:penicillin-binding transpeptidase domain-containing protein [Bacillota bacterium]MDW7683254.1 penicillin-binding transpeptidase domain-containing protein [Bacillota bacterium]
MRRIGRQKRIVVLMMFFFLATAALGARLFWLQYLHAEEFARAAVIQRSLRFVYGTGRGQILDRDGNSLLDTQRSPVLVSFEPILTEETRQVLAQNEWDTENFVHVFDHIDWETANRMQENPLPGLLVAEQEQRYGENSLAPHVTGYVQSRETLKTRPSYVELTYRAASGLERSFDDVLSAARPSTLAAIVDAHNRLIEPLGYRHWRDDDPRKPYSVVTTIDSRVQAAAEHVGSTMLQKGAIVVMEPKSGDILAMASFPDFKPKEMFTGEMSPSRAAEIDEYNRAIQKYFPGSVFKVILAAAAIENRVIDVNDSYVCTGSIDVGGENSVSCYNGTVHGEVNFEKALAVSCNGYFIRLGQLLGRETVTEMARRFKLGSPTGIPLGSESAGNIPTPEEIPFLGDLANTSIGQGDVAATPLQLARLMAIIANDGRDIYPRLVSEITDSRGSTVKRYPKLYGSQVISPSTARRLKPMLTNVVETGTAKAAKSPLYTAAGKSGTAQYGPDNEKEHSWFSAYATANGQTYVITVFVEDRPQESPRAAEIFRVLAETLF